MTTQGEQFFKEWLESQLDTATVQGGNELMPGVHVEEVQMDTGEDNEIIVITNDDKTYTLKVTQWL